VIDRGEDGIEDTTTKPTAAKATNNKPTCTILFLDFDGGVLPPCRKAAAVVRGKRLVFSPDRPM